MTRSMTMTEIESWNSGCLTMAIQSSYLIASWSFPMIRMKKMILTKNSKPKTMMTIQMKYCLMMIETMTIPRKNWTVSYYFQKNCYRSTLSLKMIRRTMTQKMNYFLSWSFQRKNFQMKSWKESYYSQKNYCCLIQNLKSSAKMNFLMKNCLCFLMMKSSEMNYFHLKMIQSLSLKQNYCYCFLTSYCFPRLNFQNCYYLYCFQKTMKIQNCYLILKTGLKKTKENYCFQMKMNSTNSQRSYCSVRSCFENCLSFEMMNSRLMNFQNWNCFQRKKIPKKNLTLMTAKSCCLLNWNFQKTKTTQKKSYC